MKRHISKVQAKAAGVPPEGPSLTTLRALVQKLFMVVTDVRLTKVRVLATPQSNGGVEVEVRAPSHAAFHDLRQEVEVRAPFTIGGSLRLTAEGPDTYACLLGLMAQLSDEIARDALTCMEALTHALHCVPSKPLDRELTMQLKEAWARLAPLLEPRQ